MLKSMERCRIQTLRHSEATAGHPQAGSVGWEFLISDPCLPLLLTAEVYISMSKPAEAAACTQEASNLFPTSHNVLYMRGQIAELRGNMDEAKRWYEEALSINPTHVKSMQRLVKTRLAPASVHMISFGI